VASEHMTPGEVASLLGISKMTLSRLRQRNEGPAYTNPSRRTVRYRKSDVEAFIASRRHGAVPPSEGAK
jgi:excisionase family DNA binding protein